MTSYQVGVAAEAFAACLLSQAGCDVSIQYGANQPGYDLVATKGNKAIKVSVKGSQDGGWGLVQNHKKEDVGYHECAEKWCRTQKSEIVFYLVQFQRVSIGDAPRVSFATPREITDQHKASRAGHGVTSLHEKHAYKTGLGAGTFDEIPARWRATQQKIDSLFS
jgi:hypothetical protein